MKCNYNTNNPAYTGEYPAGSVGCAETSGELKEGTRNRWFILFTNTMIDWGFVIGAFVPCKSCSLFFSLLVRLRENRQTDISP